MLVESPTGLAPGLRAVRYRGRTYEICFPRRRFSICWWAGPSGPLRWPWPGASLRALRFSVYTIWPRCKGTASRVLNECVAWGCRGPAGGSRRGTGTSTRVVFGRSTCSPPLPRPSTRDAPTAQFEVLWGLAGGGLPGPLQGIHKSVPAGLFVANGATGASGSPSLPASGAIRESPRQCRGWLVGCRPAARVQIGIGYRRGREAPGPNWCRSPTWLGVPRSRLR